MLFLFYSRIYFNLSCNMVAEVWICRIFVSLLWIFEAKKAKIRQKKCDNTTHFTCRTFKSSHFHIVVYWLFHTVVFSYFCARKSENATMGKYEKVNMWKGRQVWLSVFAFSQIKKQIYDRCNYTMCCIFALPLSSSTNFEL